MLINKDNLPLVANGFYEQYAFWRCWYYKWVIWNILNYGKDNSEENFEKLESKYKSGLNIL